MYLIPFKEICLDHFTITVYTNSQRNFPVFHNLSLKVGGIFGTTTTKSPTYQAFLPLLIPSKAFPSGSSADATPFPPVLLFPRLFPTKITYFFFDLQPLPPYLRSFVCFCLSRKLIRLLPSASALLSASLKLHLRLYLYLLELLLDWVFFYSLYGSFSVTVFDALVSSFCDEIQEAAGGVVKAFFTCLFRY
ncbi:MAG: hypothetical protein IPO26_16310 [Saprospiraceae bacterium]|nr:hypothetical protein [Saprospiraceae bacterium]